MREFGKEVTGIIEELKTNPDAQKLLTQRVTLMEDFANHVNYPSHRKTALDAQLKEFCNLTDRNYGAGTDKARRAELVFHSMSVLEGVAAECIKKDPDTMKYLFSPAPEAGFNQPFYRALFGAVGDPKSIKYMGAQEHEFEQFSDKHNLIYVYSAEVGPFLTGRAKPHVDEMQAKPSNITGMPVSKVPS